MTTVKWCLITLGTQEHRVRSTSAGNMAKSKISIIIYENFHLNIVQKLQIKHEEPRIYNPRKKSAEL